MKYLFSAAGETALAAQLKQPALLAFDFDGTLAPIVSQPQEAQLPAPVLPVLSALCAIAPVAIISGRSVADLKTRVDVAPKYLVGNHGLEGIPDNDALLAHCHAICARWHSQLAPLLAGDPAATGVVLEDKTYSLSLHYRLAPDPQAAAHWLHGVLAALEPAPTVIGGKHVFNLMPVGSFNKRRALESLLRRENLERALFAGDDDTDEAIFADAPLDWLTVRVEPSPISAARFFLRQQDEMLLFLQKITQLLK